jgi:hypothetical protein
VSLRLNPPVVNEFAQSDSRPPLPYLSLSAPPVTIGMNDDHEVDWGNDEDDMPSRPYFDSVGMDHTLGGVETDDVEDAVSLGGDEEEEFAAYGARSNEQNTPSADRFQTTHSKRYARRRSVSVGRTPRKEMSQVQPAPLPPSPQPEARQPTLTHALPPKPVVSSSIRAPPSTTAASPMSLPRKERRSNGNTTTTTTTTKKSDDASLSDKETKSSRTVDRESRRRDSNADESSWTRPGSNATDLQPPHRDRARGVNDRDGYPPLRREDDCYRPSYHPVYSSDEEGREPNTYRTQPRHDARYRYDDRDRHCDYASDDRVDRPAARSARHSPDDVSLDRSRSIYRESNEFDSRRAHPRDRDASPIRDDSSRRVLRRDDYPVYDSYDKSSRDYGDSSRRSSGTAERSRYPESFSGRSNSVVLRDPHTQNQGPGRSSTLSTLSTSCRPARRTPFAPPEAEDLFLFPEKLWELSSTRIYASTDSQVFIVAFSLFVSMLYAMSRSQQLFPPHVSSYRTQFPFSPPEITITPL